MSLEMVSIWFHRLLERANQKQSVRPLSSQFHGLAREEGLLKKREKVRDELQDSRILEQQQPIWQRQRILALILQRSMVEDRGSRSRNTRYLLCRFWMELEMERTLATAFQDLLSVVPTDSAAAATPLEDWLNATWVLSTAT